MIPSLNLETIRHDTQEKARGLLTQITLEI